MQMSIQRVLEHGGVFVAAITGVLAARRRRIDLFGVLVLALATAFGGGTMRDVLIGDLPVFWLRGPWFLINAVVAAVLTFIICRFRTLPERALLIVDAGSLAFFTMLGAQKGLTMKFSEPVAVLLGVITGVAGGMLRDVLLKTIPLVFRPTIHLYATASLCGAVVFVTLHACGLDGVPAVVAGGFVVFALRLAAIYWKISLPIFEAREA